MKPSINIFHILIFSLLSTIAQAQCGLDIFVANDQSGSVDNVENAQSRFFIETLMREIEPWGTANQQSRMAIAEWEDRNTWKQYNFPIAGQNYTTQMSDVISFVNSPRTLSGWTDPYDALLKSYRAINQTPIAGRTANKIIVLLTDAYCSQIQGNIVQLADQIKDEGIYIMVLAIDEAYNCSILQGDNVASPGGYFSANSYAMLQNQAINYVKNLTQRACSFIPPPPAFDLQIQLNSFNATNCQVNGLVGTYTTNYTVSNTGTLNFSNTLKIAFYDANPKTPNAQLLHTQTLNAINIPVNGTYNGSLSHSGLATATQLYAVVNMDGSVAPPLPNYIENLVFVKPERKTSNNFSNAVNRTNDISCLPRAVINTKVSHTGIACDKTLTYDIELCNTGAAIANIENFTPIAPTVFNLKNTNFKMDTKVQRIWGTYYGDAVDYAQALAIDAEGNIYMAGYTQNANNIANMATAGSHQNTSGGGQDAFLVKFNSDGVRQWATYYGGSSNDLAYALAIDAQGNIYMAGETKSTNNIATAGAHQNTSGGSEEAFLVKFNSDGVRQWGTYYGGNGWDFAKALAIDAQGNIYMAGYSSSQNNIATAGAHQNTHGGGSDAFLVKFNSAGVRQWGTYYGGSTFDYAYALALDAQGNIYMAGETNSSNNMATAGTHQNTLGGGGSRSRDAFLVKFNSAGVRQWASYYGGNNDDYAYALAIDADGNIYMAGGTESNNNIATAGSHQNSIGTGISRSIDAFLVKFNSAGVRQWGTYYGGSKDDYAYALAIDAEDNIYMAGRTASTSNIATFRSHQFTLGNGAGVDGFLVKFNSDGVRQWATYYGGFNDDEAYALAIDAQGNIYIAGYAKSRNGFSIATAGSHQSTSTANTSAFLVKFKEVSSLQITRNSCKNFQYTYDVSTAPAGTYQYSVGYTAEATTIILPDNNFSAGGLSSLNGFNGANHTSDNVVIPAGLPPLCAPGDKIAVNLSLTSNNSCGNDYAQATITLHNTSGVSVKNVVLELNLSGSGATFAGEIYNVSNSNLSFPSAFILDPSYPNIPHALYSKTGLVRMPLWQLPTGTTTFNVDISLGFGTTNLAVKVTDILQNFNNSGESNTATLAQPVSLPPIATISGFSCPGSISAGQNVVLSGISTTQATSVAWASSTLAAIPNTGSLSNPAITYTPTPKDIANGFVAISLRAINSQGCETTRSCQVNITQIQYDYGDAPISYDLNRNVKPFAGSATLHSGIFLGELPPGAENTAKNSADASADGVEEDGLIQDICNPSPVNFQNYPITVRATNNSNLPAFINAFGDWNNDGDYLDDGETANRILTIPSNSGTKDYFLNFIPQTVDVGVTAYRVRLRISTDSFSIRNPFGSAPQGEVEDHQLLISSLQPPNTTDCWVWDNTTCSWVNNGPQPTQPPKVNCWDNFVFNSTTCSWENTGTQLPQPPKVNCWDNFVFNSTTCSWNNTGTQPPQPPKVNCWDNYVISSTTCSWNNTGTQPVKPPLVNCWDNFVLNNATCSWDNTETQPPQPPKVNCWDDFVFNTTTCSWENIGSQQPPNTTDCWILDNVVCSWVNNGPKPPQPPIVNCWDNFVLNNATCSWDNTETQPPQPPKVNCWDDFVFNTTTCGWDNIGSQQPPNTTDCWILDNVVCSWVNNGPKPPQPLIVNCWDNFVLNNATCSWDNTETQPVKPPLVNCWDNFVFDNTTCTWNNTGTQPPQPPKVNCWDDFEFDNNTCTWNNKGTKPLQPATPGCWEFDISTCNWIGNGNQPPTFFNNQTICMGESYTIMGNTYTTSGTYTLVVQNAAANNCDSIIVTNLTVIDLSDMNLSATPQKIPYGGTVQLEVFLPFVYNSLIWQPADNLSDIFSTQPTATINEPTWYSVTVTDFNDCSNSDSIFVDVDTDIGCFFLPNTFTPNENIRNDLFRPLGRFFRDIIIFRIYNRWGNLVFETSDPNTGWDGTYKGEALDPGVFFYYIEGTCIDGNKQFLKGDVTLIR